MYGPKGFNDMLKAGKLVEVAPLDSEDDIMYTVTPKDKRCSCHSGHCESPWCPTLHPE